MSPAVLGKPKTDGVPKKMSGIVERSQEMTTILIATVAYVGGILFTLPTIMILVSNGVQLGALFGLVAANGLGPGLFDFVIAHGVLELSIVVAAGASGLRMGWALVQPGPYSRGDALRQAANSAVVLLIGLGPLLVASGLIEGNLSPSDAPFPLKLAVGLLTGVLFWGYLMLAGRRPERAQVPT